MVLHVLLQGMQAPARQVHIAVAGGHVEPG